MGTQNTEQFEWSWQSQDCIGLGTLQKLLAFIPTTPDFN